LCFCAVFFAAVVVVFLAVAAAFAVFGWEAAEADAAAAGAVADCGATGRETHSNTSSAAKVRKTGKGEEKPSMIPLYAELDATGAAGEPTA
jgi:hypothetical protein